MSAAEVAQILSLPPAESQAALTQLMGGREGYFFGGYIIGFLADGIFLGLLFHQFVHWWSFSRGEDRLIVRLLVYYSMIFSVAISVFLTVWIFHMFVHGFGTYKVFLEIQWMSWWFLVDPIIRSPVQAFFAERAWRMSGRKWWFAGLMILVYTGAIALGVAVKICITDPALGEAAATLTIVWLAVEISSDLAVTCVIAYCLWQSRTGWSGTDKLIGRLLRMILETQFPPTIAAIVFMILILFDRQGSSSRAFVCSPKIYVICLLAVLNSRHSLRKDLSADQTYTKGNSYVLRGMRGTTNTGINVTTETYTHVTRDPFPPTRSTNREPKMYDLEVLEQNGTSSTDKDIEDQDQDQDLGTTELGYNSSSVRLTAEDEKREVRFGA